MDQRGPHYRLLTRTLRPARICAAVQGGEGWQHRALRLIEGLSISWGGSHDLVVGLAEDGSLDPALWPLLELFDADEWARFITTPRHLQMIGDDVFGPWLDRHAESLVDQGMSDLESARRSLLETVMNDPLDRWVLPDALVSEIVRRTGAASELSGEDPVVRGYLADQPPQTTSVLDLDPLLPRIRLPAVDHLPVEVQLIAAMRWGALAPTAREQLQARDCPVFDAVVDDSNLDRMLTAAWFGPVRWWVRSEQGPAGFPQPEPFDHDLFFDETPFALSRIGCTELTRRDHRFHPHQVIVAGSDAVDFSYAHALSRVGVPAIWLPNGLLDHAVYGPPAARALTGGLTRSRLNMSLKPSERRIQIRSLSLGKSDIDDLATRVSALLRTNLAGTVEVVDDVPLPRHRIPVLGDPLHYDERVEEPFDGDTTVRRLPPLLPSSVSAADNWKLQWWTEVEQPDTPLPARSQLNGQVVAPDAAWGPTARCGRNQVSYPSHSMGLVESGSSLAQMAVRPRLRFPDAATVFRTLFAGRGWECQESSAGRYRRLTTEMWGGLDALAADLADPARFAVLRAWLAKDDKKGKVPRRPGIQRQDRRYLSLEDVWCAGELESSEVARSLLDSYLERGIVRRGFVLKCRSCMDTSWYALDDVGHGFSCKRCRTARLVTRSSWISNTDEPVPHYDLAEVVYQALDSDCHVPIGALAALKKASQAFAEAPELEVHFDGSTKVEIDLLVIADGRIMLGEAKKGDVLDGTKKAENEWLRRLKRVCEAVHADRVVFATACEDWAPTTRDRITGAFPQGTGAEVHFMGSCAR